MNEHDLSMVLNLQRLVPAGACEASNGQDDSLTASIQRGAKAVADAGTPIPMPAGTGLPPVQLPGAPAH